jgi:hypothetical protein
VGMLKMIRKFPGIKVSDWYLSSVSQN